MAPCKDPTRKQKMSERVMRLKNLKKQPGCIMKNVPEEGIICRSKALGLGLNQEELADLPSWVGKRRGQEGIFYREEEIRMIDQRKKAQFLVEPDSFSEKDITRSVISKLRPGFPSEFRHMAQYGRKPGMRGRLTYFYSKDLVEVLWPSAVEVAAAAAAVQATLEAAAAREAAVVEIATRAAEDALRGADLQTVGGEASNAAAGAAVVDEVAADAEAAAIEAALVGSDVQEVGGEGFEAVLAFESEELEGIVEKEIKSKASNISWGDIAGRDQTKTTIIETAVWPLLRSDLFTGLRKLPKVLLFFGPQGTSKKLMAECIATQTSATFFSLSALSLTLKWEVLACELVKTLFEVARRLQPSVIFVEDVEILITRSPEDDMGILRTKSEFVSQLEKVIEEEQVLVVGATENPQDISEPARKLFGKKILIPLPDQECRLDIIYQLMTKEKHEVEEGEFELISFLTEGFSETELVLVCQNAALGPVRSVDNSDLGFFSLEILRPIVYQDLKNAVDHVYKGVNKQKNDMCRNWEKQFGGN